MDKREAYSEIITAIEAGEAHAGEYDIDAIFDACYDYDANDGFVCTADEDEFWKAVQAAAFGAWVVSEISETYVGEEPRYTSEENWQDHVPGDLADAWHAVGECLANISVPAPDNEIEEYNDNSARWIGSHHMIDPCRASVVYWIDSGDRVVRVHSMITLTGVSA
jgi:hypothetical protein